MPRTHIEQFIEALGRLEADRDMAELEAIFSPDCELGNVVVPEKFHGIEGVRNFWSKYRDTFDDISSTFRNRIVSNGHAALEWTTIASSSQGNPVQYDGVSILEFENGKIKRFRAYFDPSALGRQVKSTSA